MSSNSTNGKFWYGTKSWLKENNFREVDRDFEHEIMVQVYEGETFQCEFALRWYDKSFADDLVMQVRVYDDAFRVFNDIPELWDTLAGYNEDNPSPDEMARVLAGELGYQDTTQYPDSVPYEQEKTSEVVLGEPLSEEEQQAMLKEWGHIEGVVQVQMSLFENEDLNEILNALSQKLVGNSLLHEIDYHLHSVADQSRLNVGVKGYFPEGHFAEPVA
ncbi:hypothetical protein [Salinibacter ruber]|uniref:Uncharacterized protein n=1 Tax=Salinibacter ruber TaxID=146919 RepID=A0AAW5P760_9BACT|nr:hypothetical protein [Salinibacter ruber]MCS4157745.1 hypothetical protein [Salinibacter ruber]